MTLFALLMLVLILGGLSLVLQRELQRRQQAGDATPWRDMLNQTGQRLGAWGNQVEETVTRAMTPDAVALVPDFKAWVANELKAKDEKDLQKWLQNLPEEALRALVVQLDDYCRERGVSLKWLLEGQLKADPEAHAAVTEAVKTFCRLCFDAVQIQDEVQSFRKYRETLTRFQRGEKQELAQQLLGKLREAKLVEDAPPNIVLGPAEERYGYVIEAIQQAAQRDRERFSRIWQETLEEAAPA